VRRGADVISGMGGSRRPARSRSSAASNSCDLLTSSERGPAVVGLGLIPLGFGYLPAAGRGRCSLAADCCSLLAAGRGRCSLPAAGCVRCSLLAAGRGRCSPTAAGRGRCSLPAAGRGRCSLPAAGRGRCSLPAAGSCRREPSG
jgi:hypothetical protein